ncbi:hypothetical protein IE81DRAFT_350377 [Ceraceosorus guamensis]|uniref:Uncharacterized protein n=1 Tax=Ceraceosorus guamensis TaxID=1522189 RepID=A0A316VSN7_9BASI|nr:hypothetical protein IE81DRAFT_350377 [Ceraceosorus guamensis]PWN39221.1 hypothetical protein IE81DRAFT_350377 [Ceraceosorus guamensis]
MTANLNLGSVKSRVRALLKQVRESAFHLRAALDRFGSDDIWFNIALDEVATLEPAVLKRERSFLWIEDLRSIFCPAAKSTQLPPRFWLLLLGTNACFQALSPAVAAAVSSRVNKGYLRHHHPFTMAARNVHLDANSELLDAIESAPPIKACQVHVLAFFGRPLWHAMISYDEQDPLNGEPDIENLGDAVNSFVLNKVLKTVDSGVDLQPANLTEAQCFALLSQRMELDDGASIAQTDSRLPGSAIEFQKTQINEHLRILDDMNAAGNAIKTYTMCEPLVSAIVAIAMSRDLTAQAAVWKTCWTHLHSLIATRAIIDQGAYGEVTAQGLICICKDAASRPNPARFGLSVHEQPDACSPVTQFVQASSFLCSLLSTINMSAGSTRVFNNLLADMEDCWVNFTRFSRAQRRWQEIFPFELKVAWTRMTAIIGATGQADWDLLIPVYCGDLRTPLKQNFTFIIVQVKSRKDPVKSCHPISQPWAYQGAKAPISIVLNLGTSVAGQEEVFVRCHPPAPAEDRPKTRKYSSHEPWYHELYTVGYHWQNHPGLRLLGAAAEDFNLTKYFRQPHHVEGREQDSA